jgi:hypothetical protein
MVLAVLLAIAAVGLAAFAKRRAGLSAVAFALFPLSLVTVALPVLHVYALSRSARPLAERVAELPGDTEIACLNSYSPGLSFYLGRTVTLIGEDATPMRSNFVLYWMKHTPVRPATLVAPSKRDEWLTSRRTDAFILAPDNERAKLDEWVGSQFPVRSVASGWYGASVPLAEAR